MKDKWPKDFKEFAFNLFKDDMINFSNSLGELTITVSRDQIIDIMSVLKEHDQLLLDQLVDIAGVDYPSRAARFDVVYHLLSVRYNKRLRVKISTPESHPVLSISSIFPNAVWYEREIWDLFGIPFDDHPDLRRLLTDYNFDGHPLRKDFPLTGYTQVRFDNKDGRVVYEPVSLQQEYRDFDFLSPWEGNVKEHSLPWLHTAQPLPKEK